MNGGEILACAVLSAGVIALAVQVGISIGEQRREQRIERQRGAEVKVLLDWVGAVWRAR